MEVKFPVSFFCDAGIDGNALTLEERVKEAVEVAAGGKITLTDVDVITCSNEEELRAALKALHIL